jgi:hypothetical protein
MPENTQGLLVTDDMELEDWLRVVEFIHCKHPGWMAETVLSMNRGVMERLSQEVDKRAEAETSLSYAWDKRKGWEDKVKTALIGSKMWGGTEYVQELDKWKGGKGKKRCTNKCVQDVEIQTTCS